MSGNRQSVSTGTFVRVQVPGNAEEQAYRHVLKDPPDIKTAGPVTLRSGKVRPNLQAEKTKPALARILPLGEWSLTVRVHKTGANDELAEPHNSSG